MRASTIAVPGVLLVVLLAASAPRAAALDGSVKLGGLIMNQTGDRSAVQETYDLYDGFSISELRLSGMIDERRYVRLDLREVNLDSRRGDFLYRVPGTLQLSAGFDQSRRIFSPDGGVDARRREWRTGAQLTPARWLTLSGTFQQQGRDGDRLSYPAGTASVLGTRYDNTLNSGELTAEVRRGRRGGGITYRASGYTDRLDRAADRSGQVVSARLYMPCVLYDRWTHFLRAAYGTRRLSDRDLEYTLANFQYTGVIQPVEAFRFRYRFDANRIDDHATRLQTDRFQNDFDVTYSHRYGQLDGGYGYETNDDDRTLTSYHNWRAGATLRPDKAVTAKFEYAGRVKKDQEELTLLKDIEASRIRAQLQVRPHGGIVLGGGYTRRERELPDLQVSADGDAANGYARCTYQGWGAVSADYRYTADDYQDLAGGFHTRTHLVTARVECDRIPRLRLAGGVTYMDVGEDLDIEKSLVFVEGAYTMPEGYHLEVRYNAYNYDDYVLLDRYYTANALRIAVGYDWHWKRGSE